MQQAARLPPAAAAVAASAATAGHAALTGWVRRKQYDVVALRWGRGLLMASNLGAACWALSACDSCTRALSPPRSVLRGVLFACRLLACQLLCFPSH